MKTNSLPLQSPKNIRLRLFQLSDTRLQELVCTDRQTETYGQTDRGTGQDRTNAKQKTSIGRRLKYRRALKFALS